MSKMYQVNNITFKYGPSSGIDNKGLHTNDVKLWMNYNQTWYRCKYSIDKYNKLFKGLTEEETAEMTTLLLNEGGLVL